MVYQAQLAGSSHFFMGGTQSVSITKRMKYYPNPSKAPMEPEVIDHPSYSMPPTSSHLEIERLSSESIIRQPQKGVLQKSYYNLNVRGAQHYNIVEDLAQAPSVM